MFQVPCIVTKVTTMRDKSLRLQIDTQELNAEEKALVFSLHEKFGYMAFKELPINPEDVNVPEYVPEFKDDKTPSKRLRAVIYKIWEQENSQMKFDDYYKSKMEMIIEHYKSKLE